MNPVIINQLLQVPIFDHSSYPVFQLSMIRVMIAIIECFILPLIQTQLSSLNDSSFQSPSKHHILCSDSVLRYFSFSNRPSICQLGSVNKLLCFDQRAARWFPILITFYLVPHTNNVLLTAYHAVQLCGVSCRQKKFLSW